MKNVSSTLRANDPIELPEVLDSSWLKALAMECGADDVGLVEVDRQALQDDAENIEALLPGAKSVVSISLHLNKDAMRTKWMGVVNRESSFVRETADDIASNLSHSLGDLGVRSAPAHMAFPMETQKWAIKMWPLRHKIVAVEAGLGNWGHNRLVIHPRFGSSHLLTAVVLDRELSKYDRPLEENPCNGCKLCHAACPTGAIREDGTFSFANCATHNYRHRLGGFNDWLENVVESKNRIDYRKRVGYAETMSTWQALTYGSNFTCLNCLSVCPVGDSKTCSESTAPRGKALVKNLMERATPVFVLPGSDAETHAQEHYPAESIIKVGSGLRPLDAPGFIETLHLVFQPGKAKGINATYHFDFTGAEPTQATVSIKDQRLEVKKGLVGKPDIAIKADGPTWVSFLSGETRLISALLRRRIRIKGPLSLMKSFAGCFPK